MNSGKENKLKIATNRKGRHDGFRAAQIAVDIQKQTTNPNVSPIGKRFGFECFGASVHNGLMKNSGFIGSYTHFSLAHL